MNVSGVDRSGSGAPARTADTDQRARQIDARAGHDAVVLLERLHRRCGDDDQVGLFACGQPFQQRARRVADVHELVAGAAGKGGAGLLERLGHRATHEHGDLRLRERRQQEHRQNRNGACDHGVRSERRCSYRAAEARRESLSVSPRRRGVSAL